ncbi:MAG: hypothetical protein ACRC7Q_00325 [Plesiomonas shigelloides]
MPTPFEFKQSFTLNRSHFEECFDQSVTPLTGLKPYVKTLGFGLMTVALLASPFPGYVGWFFMGLTAVEFFSTKHQRTWWVWRQLLSRAANHDVTLTITPEKLITESLGQRRELEWTSLDSVRRTPLGYLLQSANAKQYLSRSALCAEAAAFIDARFDLTDKDKGSQSECARGYDGKSNKG